MRIILYFLAFAFSCLLAGAPVHAEWRKAVSDHFVFYSDGSEKELRADSIKLERFDQLMRKLVGLADDGGQTKLTVYFVRSMDSVQKLYGGKQSNVAGFYGTSASGAFAVVPRSAGEESGQFGLSADTILFHEYAHHLMLQYFPTAYPAWYVEGFAEYVGRSDISADGKARVGLPALHRASGLLGETQLSIEKLLTAQVSDIKSGSERDTFYGQSWLMVHFLSFNHKRKGQLEKYLALLGAGTDNLVAARQAFGDLKTLNTDMRDYLKQRKLTYLNIGAVLPEPKSLAITLLDTAEGAAVLSRFALNRDAKPEEREATAATLRKLAVKHIGKAELLSLLAEAEIGVNRFEAAAAAADAALALDPKHARALLWKGLSQARPLLAARNEDKAKWGVARSWIAKANRADNFDPLPLIEYYRSFLGEGRDPPQLAIDGLGMAQSLVPQDDGLRINYASALARQKKYALAVSLLGPVANNPHGGSAASYARSQIARLQQAQTGKYVPDIDIEIPDLDGDEADPKKSK